MNIVYKITFIKRIKNNNPPFYYVGMKTLCDYKHGKVIDKSGKCYWGSSVTSSILTALKEEIPFIEVIFESNNEKLVCEKEREILISVDAAKNYKYFNQTNGTVNWKTHSSEYGTFRHRDYSGVCKKLRLDDPLVLSGLYVGTTKGYKFINNPSNLKRGRSR